MKDVDEIVLSRHSSGVGFVLSPNFNNGALCIWIDLPEHKHFGMAQRMVSTYRNKKRLAAWLRRAANAVDKA